MKEITMNKLRIALAATLLALAAVSAVDSVLAWDMPSNDPFFLDLRP
jgi:hypothetical protein